MPEYISTFPTGFRNIVRKELIKDLPNARVIDIYDGLIHYYFGGNYSLIRNIIYFNNTFFVLSVFKSDNLSFNKMVSDTCQKTHKFLIRKGTFRVRFSKENQFSKVDKNCSKRAELHVEQLTDLRIDRVAPTTEVWYIIRSEAIGFYCQLISKRDATEKTLNTGELRPEFAYLLCCCASIDSKSIVCDPFCGYGAIPQQLIESFGVKKVFASDIDKACISRLRKKALSKHSALNLDVSDALNLREMADDTVDAVITDPPWGFYERIDNIEDFYVKMLHELLRITKKSGVIVILSARKQELIHACCTCQISIVEQVNTLVNGKKATVFTIRDTTA